MPSAKRTARWIIPVVMLIVWLVLGGLLGPYGVITSAGVVLAATFAALVVIPLAFLVRIAFIVAFGVLLDTLVVRSLLVPALARDIGPAIWWPGALRRRS